MKCYCQALMICTFLFGPDLFINDDGLDDGLDDGRNNFELKTCDYYSFTPSVSHWKLNENAINREHMKGRTHLFSCLWIVCSKVGQGDWSRQFWATMYIVSNVKSKYSFSLIISVPFWEIPQSADNQGLTVGFQRYKGHMITCSLLGELQARVYYFCYYFCYF